MPMSEFNDYLAELLAPFAPVAFRRMFGGYGVFRDGLMFGLVADDTLYLKVDDATRKTFENVNSKPFRYDRKGREMALSYYEAPVEMLDEPAAAARWAGLAWDAALRARASKPPKRGRAPRAGADMTTGGDAAASNRRKPGA